MGRGDSLPVVIADLHLKAACAALRNLAADGSESEYAQTLARDSRSVDTPLVLPSAGMYVPIGLTQMASRRHQQHHGGVGDRRCVRVGAIGDGDAPVAGCVQVDSLVAGADGADDLELRQ